MISCTRSADSLVREFHSWVRADSAVRAPSLHTHAVEVGAADRGAGVRRNGGGGRAGEIALCGREHRRCDRGGIETLALSGTPPGLEPTSLRCHGCRCGLLFFAPPALSAGRSRSNSHAVLSTPGPGGVMMVCLTGGLAHADIGDWKVAGTRRQECLRHVAQAFQPAGSGDFPVPS